MICVTHCYLKHANKLGNNERKYSTYVVCVNIANKSSVYFKGSVSFKKMKMVEKERDVKRRCGVTLFSITELS